MNESLYLDDTKLTTYPFEAFNTTVLLEFIEDSRYF